MIIQFDRHKAAQGSGPTDHVWKMSLSSTELSALYGLIEAADSVLKPTSPGKAFGENILLGLEAILDQCRSGKLHPIATILTATAPEPPGLAEEINGTLPVVLTGQGEYAKAWPPESASPPGPGATIPYPEHGDHARYCPTN